MNEQRVREIVQEEVRRIIAECAEQRRISYETMMAAMDTEGMPYFIALSPTQSHDGLDGSRSNSVV